MTNQELWERIRGNKTDLYVICGEYTPYVVLEGTGVLPAITPREVYEQDTARGILVNPEGFSMCFAEGTGYYSNDGPSLVRLAEKIIDRMSGVVVTNNTFLMEALEVIGGKNDRQALVFYTEGKDEVKEITKEMEVFYKRQTEAFHIIDLIKKQ